MSARPPIEPVQVVKARRDAALARLTGGIPYARFLGVSFQRLGDEITAQLSFDPKLIGNPMLPALHGGVTGAFLELTAQVELAWSIVWRRMESGGEAAAAIERGEFPPMPKTVDFTVDYLRSGLPRDAYARARVNRAGRRYASVHVEAWQDNRDKPFAAATGHFVMPRLDEAG
ncbi:PaaI family thioesterase [Oceanicella actignis]|uniref:Acyl-coenzyme A thioesterase PaaI, contains HGG motif n=1 Tax=Oceanicella actignis TaxID=1189325 RepID=A0A1M7SV93_9RHOB|nr:PaaI family thioesterase [Oceanicella actignis]TYO90629.1 acyl-coenzyme A thioesterase PaaI-like protein [Oceanicella actignis]SES72264.1 Acyl-coenzyme A thioesterase PaaI, contains HGG motif [Oceanicella actignis]SHN62382.1 Acyl-coenzyme A thioesterase PaaI, contains HGG motif [Oceanicella actignis]